MCDIADPCEKGDESRSVFLVLSGRCSISIDVERYQMNTRPYTPHAEQKQTRFKLCTANLDLNACF